MSSADETVCPDTSFVNWSPDRLETVALEVVGTGPFEVVGAGPFEVVGAKRLPNFWNLSGRAIDKTGIDTPTAANWPRRHLPKYQVQTAVGPSFFLFFFFVLARALGEAGSGQNCGLRCGFEKETFRRASPVR